MGNIIGIDLGTTYSAFSRLNDAGIPEMLADSDGNTLIPSCVAMVEGKLCVGEEARRQWAIEPSSGAARFKRDMEESGKNHSINGQDYSPKDLSAHVLRHNMGQTLSEPIAGSARLSLCIRCGECCLSSICP